MTAVASLFVLLLLEVISTFTWGLPNSTAVLTEDTIITFYVLTSIASAVSFCGIVMTM